MCRNVLGFHESSFLAVYVLGMYIEYERPLQTHRKNITFPWDLIMYDICIDSDYVWTLHRTWLFTYFDWILISHDLYVDIQSHVVVVACRTFWFHEAGIHRKFAPVHMFPCGERRFQLKSVNGSTIYLVLLSLPFQHFESYYFSWHIFSD